MVGQQYLSGELQVTHILFLFLLFVVFFVFGVGSLWVRNGCEQEELKTKKEGGGGEAG